MILKLKSAETTKIKKKKKNQCKILQKKSKNGTNYLALFEDI